MSWWLFIPVAWIATGSNLIFARELSWHNRAPDFLLLLFSFIIVRPSVSRRLWQAVCLGLLMDFSGTGIPGIDTASAVITVAVLSRWTRTESEESASWLMWAFPAMCLCAGLAMLGMHVLVQDTEFTVVRVMEIPLTSIVTMVWGIGFCILFAMLKRLMFAKERTFSREPDSLSFFLSR